MRVLATKIGISDVALKKLLVGHGIVTPPQGHWNRVHAGRAVTPPPRPPARRPGESGRIRLDARFRGHIAETASVTEEGPFASPEVPEELADLRAHELARIGRLAVPRDLARPHPGLAPLLRREADRRGKAAASSWHWDAPHFDTPLAQRQLRIVNALLLAVARRGHGGHVREENEELKPTVHIGDMCLSLEFAILGSYRKELRGGWQRPARDLPARTPLKLTVKGVLRAGVTTAWQDSGGRPLEKQLAEIVADLIVAGEAAFRQSLVEAREHAEQMRRWEEERLRRRREELNRERLGHLEQSGSLLRQAEDLRALVARVSGAVAGSGLALGEGEFDAWREWALARADELDPVLSGQVLRHIRQGDSG